MTKTAGVYGGALYDLAREEGKTEEILQQLRVISDLFQKEAQFVYLLATPSLPKEERCGILDTCLRGRVDPYLLNFLKILCENGIIGQLVGCLRAYKDRYNEDHGILEVWAVTAVPMNDRLRKQLCDRLAQVTGRTIELACRVDPACLGGVRLEMEGYQLDGTLRARFDAVRRQLQDVVL